MLRLFMFAVLGLALAGCGQATPGTTPAAATGAALAIPGTHLLLVPPPGFTRSTAFTGLENAAGSRLSIMDVTPNNYLKHASEYTRQALEAQGATVLDFQQTTISGYPARYAYVQTAEGQKAYQFMFGDSTFVAIVMGELAPGREQDGPALKQAVLASKYDKNLHTDALANAPFRLDTRHSDFHFFKATGGMYIFGQGDPDDSSNPNAPILMVTPLPAEPGTHAADMKDVTLESLSRNGLNVTATRNISTASVNGYEAYQVDIYCEKEGKKGVFYELFLVHDGKAVTVQGVVPNADAATTPAALQQLKDLARTITLGPPATSR